MLREDDRMKILIYLIFDCSRETAASGTVEQQKMQPLASRVMFMARLAED